MPWPDSVQVTFNCNDIGSLPVEILVKDAGGLMAKCQTSVQISDPNSVCRAPSQPAIFGLIETEERKPIVANVKLQSSTNPTAWQMTRAANYRFLGMPRGFDCDLTPSRDSDLINGVTTFDVALMSRHILDVQPITSALKQIAGDVNADGAIDAVDMVITRRLVLRQLDFFPNNRSWRFLPKVFQFPSTATTVPLTSYPEFLAFTNLTDTVRSADFWAVKTGDLNGSASGPSFRGDAPLELRGGDKPLIFKAKNEFLEKDRTYDIAISSDKMDADGFQFTLNYDKSAIKMLSFEQGELSNFTSANYALFPSEGKATVSWNGSPDSKTSPMNIFRLRFTAKQSVQLSDVLRLTSDLTPAEAFSLAGGTRSVSLTFNGQQNNDFTLFQNEPNPTIGGTTNIRFRLPEASETTLTFYDLSGRILKKERHSFAKGENIWHIATPTLSGIVLYRLDTPTHSATRRMMIGQ
jgi:large repetitive protein